ncbi:hypothetical protein AB0F91_13020 [Amycolatopsis sp. NPDC023774]|uniref:hypothetical protein n=1 Tax=Amycolatopsis sp. NPDC023774 TaxID=3155015 RepID=UPI0033D96B62
MSTPSHPTDRAGQWLADTLTALRRGRRLVAELPASRPGRRAFIDISPLSTAADTEARSQCWKRADHAAPSHSSWDYAAGRLDSFDHEVGAILIKTATVVGEPDLASTLEAWHLYPDQFRYPRHTEDPQ